MPTRNSNKPRASARPAANPSGVTAPVWYQDVSGTIPNARPGARTDVCIVGAGIAGLTTAYLLARAGKRVHVIDEKPVGGGETGRTSAHLASVIDDRFQHIERIHGRAACRLHFASHAVAIDLIERIQADERIACDFARLPGYLFPDEGTAPKELERELAAAQRAGASEARLLGTIPGLPRITGPCLRFPGQARFHPLKYVRGLAAVVSRMGGRIHFGTRVMDLSGSGPVKAKLQGGSVITADAGVSATNIPTPINNWMGIYTKQAPYRTYVVGLGIPTGSVPDALYWDLADPYHYVRVHRVRGREILLVGGEDHKTGQAHGQFAERFDRLEAWAHERFPAAGQRICQWSGQVNEPDDGIAFIGRVPTKGNSGCYVITGDSGMGLTHGTLGAVLVSDLILGRPNPWTDLYDPKRRQTRSVGEFIRENLNAAVQYADYVAPSEVASSRGIPRGEGAVIRSGAARIAVYRDGQGTLHRRSAVCPHLKCIVHWNTLEKSWDCPCHGSRFDAKGGLIMGPSINDLTRP